jgi:hypothetical protein
MKKVKQIFYSVLLLIIAAFSFGCNEEASPSLYQVEPKGNIPVISSMEPANEALAGVTEITINGSNFSSVSEENFVFFGTAKAVVLSASPNKLVVKAPKLIQNQLNTKIAVQGVEDFSNVVKYNLLEAVGIYYAFTKGVEDPMTVTIDKDENVYVYLNNRGVKKITPAGVISDFAPKGAESFFFDMKFGPNNILYGTRNLRAIFQVEAGKVAATYVTFPTGNAIVALDFDANKNMWAAGTGGNLFSITPAKVITAFPIDYSVSSIRVYNGYLYVAGKKDSEEAIYRYKINSETSIGDKEKYFDIGAKYGLGKVTVGALAFSADGDLIIGSNQNDALIVVKNGGTASGLYPGLIAPTARSLVWGTKRNLFYVREYTEVGTGGTVSILHTLVRVDMQKTSAPYYGIQ